MRDKSNIIFNQKYNLQYETMKGGFKTSDLPCMCIVYPFKILCQRGQMQCPLDFTGTKCITFNLPSHVHLVISPQFSWSLCIPIKLPSKWFLALSAGAKLSTSSHRAHTDCHQCYETAHIRPAPVQSHMADYYSHAWPNTTANRWHFYKVTGVYTMQCTAGISPHILHTATLS